MSVSDNEVSQDFSKALEDANHPYHHAAVELLNAYEQMAMGKGKERHANDLPFIKQPMQSSADLHGEGFIAGQVSKKLAESKNLGISPALHEIRGAIVYSLGLAIYRMRKEGLI